jgi:hypothetical protein
LTSDNTIRRDVKQAIANELMTATGLKNVYTYRRKMNVATEYPFLVIALPKSKETALTMSRPLGRKKLEFTAQLEIYYQDASPDGSGQLVFDDLLDAIDIQLRSQPNLNSAPVGHSGIVLASAVEHIDTTVAPPQLIGQAIAMLAVKQFDVTVQVTG